MKFPSSVKLLLFAFLLGAVYSCTEDKQSGDLLYDQDGLLTDLGLAVTPDEDIGQVKGQFEEWAVENVQPIRSLDNQHFSDLEAFSMAFSNKRIVFLGASTTGAHEFDQLRLRMIKFLHEHLGYNVLCLPGTYFDVWQSVQGLPEEEAISALMKGLHPPTSTAFLDLYKYIKNCQKEQLPLFIHGIDIDDSVPANYPLRSQLFRTAIEELGDMQYASEVHDFDQQFAQADELAYLERLSWLSDNGQSMTNNYDNLHTYLWNQKELLLQTQERDVVAAALRTSWSMAQYLRYLLSDTDFSGRKNEELRNRAQANQIKFLMDELYPVERLMVWTSNQNSRYFDELIAGQETTNIRSVLSFVAEKYPLETYAIGTYMNRGFLVNSSLQSYEIPSARENSVEAILYSGGWKYGFTELQNQSPDSGNAWMFNESVARSRGTNELKLVPVEQYDALLFVDEVSPQEFLTD